MPEGETKGPIPLNLDWDSPEGKAHHEQMSRLSPEDPVARAHFRNRNMTHPRARPAAEEKITAGDVGTLKPGG